MDAMLNNFNIHTFSKIETLAAEDIIKEIAPNSFIGGDCQLSPIENKTFDKEYQGSLARQPKYKNCYFTEVYFDGIDGVSSSILDCYFTQSRFKDAGLDFSDFTGSHFLSCTKIINCGCSDCNFTETEFENILADGCTFCRCFFTNANIKDTVFVHCSFEDTIFENTHFYNTNLTQASLEFSTFQHVHFQDTVLPFWGVLKSFNALQNVKLYEDEVSIQASINAKKLSAKEFLHMLDTLQPYFYKQKEYFILANINIFYGHQNIALKYILEGLRYYLDSRDFRQIRYLCQLASNNHFFSRDQLHFLYNVLAANEGLSKMNHHEYQIYLNELDNIKRILIDNPYFMPQMTITYHTAFKSDDYESLAVFLHFIDHSIKEHIPQCSYYLTIRRNSPPIVESFISDTLPNLYSYFLIVAPLLIGMNKAVVMLKEALEAKGIALDNKYKKQSLRLQELEIEHKKLENIKLKAEIDKNKEKEDSFLEKKENLDLKLLVNIQNNINSASFSIKSMYGEDIPIREYTIFHEDSGQNNSGQ